MAKESGSHLVKPTDVDLDNVEVHLLVVGKSFKNLGATAAFLRRRGWPTNVVCSATEAIESIAQQQPDFILISFTNTDPAVVRLPDLIATSFNIPCIGIVETGDGGSTARLNAAKLRHKVQGVASGPSLQRAIRKILAEKLEVAERTTSSSPESGLADEAPLTIHGDAPESLSVGTYRMSKATRFPLKSLLAPTEGSVDPSNLTNALLEQVGTVTTPTEPEMMTMTDASDGTNVNAIGFVGALLPEPNLSAEARLVRAVEATLRRVCQPEPGVSAAPLGSVTQIGVFPLEGPETNGYLVIGLPPNPSEDQLLKSCETTLAEELAGVKYDARLDAGFWVHVPEVHFRLWAAHQAQFLRSMGHADFEVAVAYFPRPADSAPKAQNAGGDEMLAVALETISTEHPVNFRTYLHLELNNKYFLYLRQGRTLQPEQKSRLKERKVENVFMKPADAENLKQFLASTFLSGKIKSAA